MNVRENDLILSGRYRLVKELGRGYSGTVYLAEHQGLQTLRAVKCISRKHVMYRQFLKEATLLKNLKHPGIPIIYDLEEDETYLYIIEEYAEGDSLKEVMLHQQHISQETIITYGIQICDILLHLHLMRPVPVLYLDLKPSHIIVNQGQLKIIDFGSVRRKDEAKSYTLGTPGFAAPELYQGETPEETADVYSIGAVLYYMATGNEYRPSQDSAGELKCCSRQLRRVIGTCLKEAPGKRYRTAEEVRSALQKIPVREQKIWTPSRQLTDGILRKGGIKQAPSWGSGLARLKIGVAGYEPKTGTTHLAIMLGNFLVWSGYRTILVQREDTDTAYLEIQRAYEGTANIRETDKKFTIFHLDYHRNAADRELTEAISGPYEVLVIDYGNIFLEDEEEFRRCDIQIITGSLCEWKRSIYLQFLKEHTGEGDQSRLRRTALYASAQDIREAAHEYPFRLISVPFEPDPFHPGRETRAFLSGLLRR